MKFNEHSSYKISFELSNLLWKIIKKWNDFDRDTLGKQLIRSADSISSNIAEGWHRYYKKDKILFFNYSRSSFYEMINHINKATNRNLINKSELQLIINLTKQFPKEINGLIKGIKQNLKR